MKEEIEQKKQDGERLIRILSTDIRGGIKIYPGLTKIKGISWSFSNAICKRLGIDKNKRIDSLTSSEIGAISEFIKKPEIPNYLLNRRADFETGENKHLLKEDLKLRTEFDIKKMKKIKSYRGLRHSLGQPVRGQRTKSHFRTNKKRGVGLKKKQKAPKESR